MKALFSMKALSKAPIKALLSIKALIKAVLSIQALIKALIQLLTGTPRV